MKNECRSIQSPCKDRRTNVCVWASASMEPEVCCCTWSGSRVLKPSFWSCSYDCIVLTFTRVGLETTYQNILGKTFLHGPDFNNILRSFTKTSTLLPAESTWQPAEASVQFKSGLVHIICVWVCVCVCASQLHVSLCFSCVHVGLCVHIHGGWKWRDGNVAKTRTWIWSWTPVDTHTHIHWLYRFCCSSSHTHSHIHKQTCTPFRSWMVSIWSQIKMFHQVIYIVTTPEVTIPHRTKTSNQRARDSYLSVYIIYYCANAGLFQ